jgi:hypothetical protein
VKGTLDDFYIFITLYCCHSVVCLNCQPFSFGGEEGVVGIIELISYRARNPFSILEVREWMRVVMLQSLLISHSGFLVLPWMDSFIIFRPVISFGL